MDPDEIKQVPLKDLKTEEGADELMDSAFMQPYVRFAMAVMGHSNVDESVAEIAALPLEERYVWRVASALKWAFADFDDLSVGIDRETLSPEDHKKIVDLLKHRPLQFCMFLKTLIGEQEMQRMMLQAIKAAKQFP